MPPFDRKTVEAAMRAYDEFRESGKHSGRFKEVRENNTDYWARSTWRRSKRYPTMPILRFCDVSVHGGWKKEGHDAARLHNSGFIIVDEDNTPIRVPKKHDHLIRGAGRIRLCAVNYYIEPARERGDKEVSIRASDLARDMGLKNGFRNICQALGGKKLQKLANVPKPDHTEPNSSSATTFTYKLGTTARLGSRSETDDTDYNDEDEAVGVEGRRVPRKHLVRERDPKLAKRKKDRVLKEFGKLVCEACEFDFAKTYGDRGDGFIECHHITPVSELQPGSETSLDDLALVCSNCHRMIHREHPWLSIEKLRQIIEQTAS